MTAREVLDGINTRLAAATPGPWEFDGAEITTVPDYESANPTPWKAVMDCEVSCGSYCYGGSVAMSIGEDDRAFIAAAPVDVARLTRAVEAVLALHQPERRWLPYKEADRSYDTAEEAAQDLDHTYTIDPANMPYFEVCAHCKTVEEGPCDGECTKELGYRESLWPCPTVAAIEDALGEAS